MASSVLMSMRLGSLASRSIIRRVRASRWLRRDELLSAAGDHAGAAQARIRADVDLEEAVGLIGDGRVGASCASVYANRALLRLRLALLGFIGVELFHPAEKRAEAVADLEHALRLAPETERARIEALRPRIEGSGPEAASAAVGEAH